MHIQKVTNFTEFFKIRHSRSRNFGSKQHCCVVDTHTHINLLLLWFSFFFQRSYMYCMYCMLVMNLILSCLVLASLKTRHGRNIISFFSC